MDVEAAGWVEVIIAEVVPILPIEQRTDLHQPHIVVGIAQPQRPDLRPSADDIP
jgi:hypothetical protein